MDDESPAVIAHLPGGLAVMGDTQFLPGYSLLLSDDPDATRLSELAQLARAAYLRSLEQLAEAVERACAKADPAFRRVNIEILGNTEPHLHAHIWPRYDWEDPTIVLGPVWLYPEERWSDPATALGPQHDALRASIARNLAELTSELSPD
jgi:diadenosine tetraphosphate (Ap4A) HIT family hydrolase